MVGVDLVGAILVRLLLLRVMDVMVVVLLPPVRLRVDVIVRRWGKSLERREAEWRCGPRGFLVHLRNEPVGFAEAGLYGLVDS